MELLFGVSDFGKIKHAEITLSDFTLFVGDNNSGKTFMMQLLYGVLKELRKMKPVIDGIEERGENQLVFGTEWFSVLEEKTNVFLSQNKEKIIRRIFQKNIEIGELYFRLVNINELYVCKFEDYEIDYSDKKNVLKKIPGRIAHIYVTDVKEEHSRIESSISFHYRIDSCALKDVISFLIWTMIVFCEVGFEKKDLLFLPASRTGLQLLSKYFFAERDRKLVEDISFFDVGKEENRGKPGAAENRLGLTMPVYDFMQFLVRYNQRAELEQENRELLSFIEKHLIDGQVKYLGDETFYHPEALTDDKGDIPLYLASSLVNEVTPIIKALSGQYSYSYIFYDEIETCLHPLKQGEMARLVIRLVNSGRKMIVSTHSDTMAGKLNNLLLLSFSEDAEKVREKKLKKLGLEKADLLNRPGVHVYQFVNQEDGGSQVEELKFQTMPYVGYDFNLFMQNIDELYQETDIILE